MNRQSQISNLNLFSIIRGGAEAAGNPAKTDQTGDAYKAVTQMFSRLMPLEMVKSQPDKVLALFLETITNSGSNLNYFLGGNIMKIAGDDTSMHPAVRKSIWSVFTTGKEDSAKVRSLIPNNVTGICYNHHNTLEPDWRNASWGANYDRLNAIKEMADPNHVFNCWHCVGYRGGEENHGVQHKVFFSLYLTSSFFVIIYMYF